MKTLSKLLLLFTLLSLISCNDKTPLIKFKGGIIYNKEYISREYVYYDIYYNKEIIRVKVFPIDTNYKIGDTIK